MRRGKLLVLYGPTGVGKSELAVRLSEVLGGVPIVSCDSRQFYREMRIGTAVPSAELLGRAEHFFIGNKSVTESYSCGEYEGEVIPLLERLFEVHDWVLLVGGSMLYIDAVCDGMADVPSVLPEVRREVWGEYEERGIEFVRDKLRLVDPVYYGRVDLQNAKRMLHALEVFVQTGRPFSSFHGQGSKVRSFDVLKVELCLPREVLFDRINRRVDVMLEEGLEDEVRGLLPYRGLNALNTVGYKELFRVLDGEWSRDFAVEKVKVNTRLYAKKQLLWFRRYEGAFRFRPTEINEIVDLVQSSELRVQS